MERLCEWQPVHGWRFRSGHDGDDRGIHREEWLEQLKDYLDGNFAYIDEYLKKYLPKAHLVKAEGTYLAWLDLNGYVDRDEKKLEELMQKKAKVALDEGYIFGEEGRGFERINVASPRSVIEECMNRIRTAFEEEKLV